MATTARFTVPKLNLTQLLKKPGGVPVADAVAAAQANLASLKPQCMTELHTLLEAAETVFGRLGATYDYAGVASLYQTAVRGIGLGDVCGAGSVDVALTSLCDLLDHLKTNERYDAEAVGVHLRAWRLLISTEIPPEGAQAVLAGLNRVSAKYGAPQA
jgi:hypothetical protein